jgi:hypothetical protein
MKPEQQRIAIAEACGWEFDHHSRNEMYYVPSEDFLVGNPLHDLNAMHEAEKMLYGNPNLPKKYTQQIKNAIRREAGVTKAQMDFDVCITATAAHRAEAFLRTIGKWTTNQNEL